MKLHDCDCGGTPEVTYKINDHSDVEIGCTLCGNRTPMCETLTEAISLWNQVYCCTLPFHEIETG